MRQLYLFPLLLVFSTRCFAQLNLKINISKDDNVTFELNNKPVVKPQAQASLGNTGNSIVISNAKKINDYTIRLQRLNSSPFTISFGKKSNVNFVDGSINKTFNKGEVIDGQNAISLPANVTVFDANKKVIGALVLVEKIADSPVIVTKKDTDTTRGKTGKDSSNNPGKDVVKIAGLTNIAFYDSKTLSDTTITKEEYVMILSYYAGSKTILSDEDLSNAYAENPFINYDTKDKRFSNQTTTNSVGTALSSLSVSSLGNLNVTNIADGIAQFLIKRGKEEINAAFFDRLNNFLNKNKEFQTLFPATYEFLENIPSYKYAEFIQSLRVAFEKDLSNAIVNLNLFIELPQYQKLLENLPEIRLAIHSAKIVSELSQSGNGILPDSIIHQLAGLKDLTDIHPNLKASFQLLDLLSQSLRNPESRTDSTANRWIKLSDFNQFLIGDEKIRKYYLGLLWQKGDNITFIKGNEKKTFRDFLKENSPRILKLTSFAENFVIMANDVDNTIKDIRESQKVKKLTNEDYYTYINKAINIVEYGFTLAQYVKPEIKADNYIKIARNGNNLYKDIYTKNYNSAVMDVYNILDQVFNNRNALKDERLNSVGAKLSNADKDSLNVAVADKVLPTPKLLKTFLTYGNFIASVVKAESAEEVESAIEAAALPTGSYSIKQHSSFNFGLNGFIGYAWDFTDKELYARGVYAPVGLAVSWGIHQGKCGAFTLFGAIIDVGSIATYRLANGNTDTLKQDVRLESIFSPSLQAMYSIPKWPVAICAGYRRTPRMFYSSESSFKSVNPRDVFNLAILIDIPLFNFVNRPFNIKR